MNMTISHFALKSSLAICKFMKVENGIVVTLVKIFKTNGFYSKTYLMTHYPLENCG